MKNALGYNVYHRCLCYFLHQISERSLTLSTENSSSVIVISYDVEIPFDRVINGNCPFIQLFAAWAEGRLPVGEGGILNKVV